MLDDGLVAARGYGGGWRSGAEGAHVVDAGGRTAVPGFIDLHCHGGGGASAEDVAADPADLARIVDLHRRHGTTRSLLSLVSDDLSVLSARSAALAPLVEADPLLLGVHLEGPFLAGSHRGAHREAALRTPTPDALALLQDGGPVTMITIAPELPGAIDAIDALVAAGVIVAIGHTAADHATARDAFARGARVLTHAFNGMPGIHHRAPGPVVAALETAEVVIELIVDGVHVHPSVIACAMRAAPGRVAFVSDAMAAAGAPDGAYQLGGLDVTVRDGVATHGADDALAGSTLTLDRALANAVAAGIPLVDAVTALTSTPASVLGLQGRIGTLTPGAAADLVLLGEDLVPDAVWAGGVLVHLAPVLCDRERSRAARPVGS
ncbi:N-acetylglucosamine-6-phosphate deacetylase [Microbacterium oleivorans]|uniref:N-acetylglucosamine-6-phosphate deacetylase n=2 Tax=Microbacterium oleivorans TaxID=273677 RepID=A0A7D5J183_9MICO|nr:N-acetylglucosamine-6-phosphate deacetylase [Microbacterium oleivorans]